MNKNKWNKLPPGVQKVFIGFSKEFNERWNVEWNKIDIEGKEFFTQQGGQIVPLSDAEAAKWMKAAEPVIVDHKQDVVSKGSKAADVALSIQQERLFSALSGEPTANPFSVAYMFNHNLGSYGGVQGAFKKLLNLDYVEKGADGQYYVVDPVFAGWHSQSR